MQTEDIQEWFGAFQSAWRQGSRPERFFLIIDQGGTNIRVCLYAAGPDWDLPVDTWRIKDTATLVRSSLRSDRELYEMLEAVANALPEGAGADRVRVVIDFAGAVSPGRDSVRITNWDGQPTVTLTELRGRLRGAGVLMLNDVEAGAFGLLALEEFDSWPERACLLTENGLGGSIEEYDPDSRLRNNKVLLIPGTGLGTAGIHVSRIPPPGGAQEANPSEHRYWAEPVPSEIQHSRAPADSPLESDLISGLRVWHCKGRPPGHERIVSGEGLAVVYDFLFGNPARPISEASLRTRQRILADPDPTAEIAKAAQSDPPDSVCLQALSLYYAYCGRVAQNLALAFKAAGGVYLAGETTTRNWPFVSQPQNSYVTNFRANDKQEPLLKTFPLFLIDQPDLNLWGDLYAACFRWHLTPDR